MTSVEHDPALLLAEREAGQLRLRFDRAALSTDVSDPESVLVVLIEEPEVNSDGWETIKATVGSIAHVFVSRSVDAPEVDIRCNFDSLPVTISGRNVNVTYEPYTQHDLTRKLETVARLYTTTADAFEQLEQQVDELKYDLTKVIIREIDNVERKREHFATSNPERAAGLTAALHMLERIRARLIW